MTHSQWLARILREFNLPTLTTAKPTQLAAALPIVLCTTLLAVPTTSTADEAIIIGGGYALTTSQGQIELNVDYARQSLADKGIPAITYFTDGGAPGRDVFIQHEAPLDEFYEPLARVFGDPLEQNREYKDSTLDNIAGSTKRDELLPALQDILGSAEEPLWLLYNGHGKQSFSTPDHVTLELWDNTQVTANELHGELSSSKQPIRYVFTQCYSGGFHALAYDQPDRSLTPAKPQRCGFTAVSAFSLAEGCSASINTDDYRDYTTHFFAAASGFERNGNIVVSEPDTNDDGQVSPREAHLYTLLNANSTDIARSTSEDFLERWEPWYLKFAPGVKDLPSNEYAKLFRELAAQNRIPLNQDSVGIIRTKLKSLEEKRSNLATSYTNKKNQMKQTRNAIAEPLIAQWPALMGPYTAGFQALSTDGSLQTIIESITGMDEYATLVEQQNALIDLENEQLSVDRNAANLQKLLHLRRIATLKQQLQDYGSPADKSSYDAFVQCEEAPF